MTCAEIKLKLSAYQDNEVAQSVHAEIQRHLQICDSCQHEWQQLQQVWQHVKGLAEVEPMPQFTALVMGKIGEKKIRKLRFIPSMVYSFVFALFFIMGLLFYSSTVNGKQAAEDIPITQLLVKSQNLNLINIQDPTIDLIAYGGNYRGR